MVKNRRKNNNKNWQNLQTGFYLLLMFLFVKPTVHLPQCPINQTKQWADHFPVKPLKQWLIMLSLWDRVSLSFKCGFTTAPVPQGQRPDRRSHECAHLWGWTQSAQCRSPTHRCKAPCPLAPWPPELAPDVALNCKKGKERREEIRLVFQFACSPACAEGGWGIHPASRNHWHEMNTLSLHCVESEGQLDEVTWLN